MRRIRSIAAFPVIISSYTLLIDDIDVQFLFCDISRTSPYRHHTVYDISRAPRKCFFRHIAGENYDALLIGALTELRLDDSA